MNYEYIHINNINNNHNHHNNNTFDLYSPLVKEAFQSEH